MKIVMAVTSGLAAGDRGRGDVGAQRHRARCGRKTLAQPRIYAYRDWQSTGLMLHTGDRVYIRARGTWLYTPVSITAPKAMRSIARRTPIPSRPFRAASCWDASATRGSPLRWGAVVPSSPIGRSALSAHQRRHPERQRRLRRGRNHGDPYEGV